MGAHRRAADEGRRAEGRAEVPVEDEARQRYASAQLPDDAGADGSVDLASRVQGARVPRRQLGADVCRRHRPRPRLLDDGHQLLVDHAAREQLVGLPRRADRSRDAPDVVCRVGVRRRRRWRPRWPVGELCWRAWKRRAEPRARRASARRPRRRAERSRSSRQGRRSRCTCSRSGRPRWRWRRRAGRWANGQRLRPCERRLCADDQSAQRVRSHAGGSLSAGQRQRIRFDLRRWRALHKHLEQLRCSAEWRVGN